MTIDTEIRHVTKVGSNLFQELGFSADSHGQLASTTPTYVSATHPSIAAVSANPNTTAKRGKTAKISPTL
jgi:hypothetical protein